MAFTFYSVMLSSHYYISLFIRGSLVSVGVSSFFPYFFFCFRFIPNLRIKSSFDYLMYCQLSLLSQYFFFLHIFILLQVLLDNLSSNCFYYLHTHKLRLSSTFFLDTCSSIFGIWCCGHVMCMNVTSANVRWPIFLVSYFLLL